MSKSIAKNSLFNMTYKLLNVFFPMITAMYVARVLMPSGVGQVGYAQNILSYFTVIASLGIPTYGAREIARVVSDKKQSNKLFSELFVINFCATFICSIVYILMILSIPTFHTQFALFIAVGIQLFLNILNVDWYYTGNEEYVYITVRSTIIKILALCSIFLFVKDSSDLIVYAFINALAVSGNYLFNVLNLRKKVRLELSNLDIKRHLKPVLVLLLTTLATDLYNQVDVTMMGSMCTESEIGFYTYAIKLIRIVTSISTAIAITTLPRMSRYYIEKKQDEFVDLFNRTINAMMSIVAPCFVGIIMVATDAVSVVYGNSFLPSAQILVCAAPILMIVAISYECGSIVLTAVNKEKYLLIATFSGVIVNIGLNLFLIPRYMGQGAAIASVCAEIAVLIVHLLFSKKYLKLAICKRDGTAVACSIVAMILVITIIQKIITENMFFRLILSIVFGGATYCIGMIVINHSAVKWVMKKIKR